jgi:hypothetical protein
MREQELGCLVLLRCGGLQGGEAGCRYWSIDATQARVSNVSSPSHASCLPPADVMKNLVSAGREGITSC